MKERWIELRSLDGIGEAINLRCTMTETGEWFISELHVEGQDIESLTTQNITDYLNKRFVTDAQRTALTSLTPVASGLVTLAGETIEKRLANVSAVDLNTTDPTALYTVPTGKNAFITKIIVRDASISLDTASYSFGFNSATYNDVIADATHVELADGTVYTVLTPKVGAKFGTPADVLNILPNIAQGAAATVTVDVFGYLEDV